MFHYLVWFAWNYATANLIYHKSLIQYFTVTNLRTRFVRIDNPDLRSRDYCLRASSRVASYALGQNQSRKARRQSDAFDQEFERTLTAKLFLLFQRTPTPTSRHSYAGATNFITPWVIGSRRESISRRRVSTTRRGARLDPPHRCRFGIDS